MCVCDYMLPGSLRPFKPHGQRGAPTHTHTWSEVIGERVTGPGNETHLRLQLHNINSHLKHVASHDSPSPSQPCVSRLKPFPLLSPALNTNSRVWKCHSENTQVFLSRLNSTIFSHYFSSPLLLVSVCNAVENIKALSFFPPFLQKKPSAAV